MITSLLLSFLSLLLILRSVASDDQLSFSYHLCNNTQGNITSTYKSNLDTLLAKLTSGKEIDYGFYNLSLGQNSDKVNAVGLCRGDVKPDNCRGCLERSATLLTERCPYQKEATGWYDKCMLRYSSRSIFGVMLTNPFNVMCNPNNVSDVVQFKQVTNDLLDRLKSTVNASGDSRRKFAEADAPLQPSNESLHALLQCTPDLSTKNCSKCFDLAFSEISFFCGGKRGARYMGPSCSVRYETTVFFEPISVAPQPEASANNTLREGRSRTARTVIAVVVPVVALVVLLILIYIYLRVRKPAEHIESEGELDNEIKNTGLLQFDFETIKDATQDFSGDNWLGEGGFGIVHKGKLSTGQEVAIKRLSNKSCQGGTEFKNEVLLTGKLQHRNLVRLLGFCLEKGERLLIYEFVPNKSLDNFIFDEIKRTELDWEKRYKIIIGIAGGLLYLHEESGLQIIHRDLKTSNILLDDKLNPKISDFGMARLFDVNQIQGNTRTIVGTHGYMAPEYVKYGQFSVKSDVFSFGVMVLEIVCGQKNNETHSGENGEDLLSFAWKNWKEGTASKLVDPKLHYESSNEIMRCIQIGLLCVQENIADRPTMASIVPMLNGQISTLPNPSEPAFFMRGKSLPAIPSGEQNSKAVTSSAIPGSQCFQGLSDKAPIMEIHPR